MVRLQLLGTTDIQCEGRDGSLALTGPKRLGLLTYLVLARPCGFHRRDKLVALFWPERGQKAARNSLSNLLYHLRRTLGPDRIVNRGDEEVGLDRDALWCDVLAFERALDENRRQEACTLYQGPLLDGFHVPGAASTFEHWLDAERNSLELRYWGALEGLAEEAEEQGAYERAAAWWSERARASPSDGPVLCRLIGALARAGRRSDALRTARANAQMLRDEFGVGPEKMVQSLTEGGFNSAL